MLLIELTWIIVDQIPPDAEAVHFDFTADRVLTPLIRLLSKHPALKIGLALSPALIDYLMENDNDLLKEIRRLVENDRVELLAALMTPIESISPAMVRYHLQLHKTYYMDVFDVDIKGVVLWGYAWASHLLPLFLEQGYSFAVINRNAQEVSCGYSSFLGKKMVTIGVDPVLSRLSSRGPIKQFFRRIRSLSKANNRQAALITTTRQLGLETNSYERCWNEGLLRRIAKGFEQAQKWLKLRLPHRFKVVGKAHPTEGYFPLEANAPEPWSRRLAGRPELELLDAHLSLLESRIGERALLKEPLSRIQSGVILCPYPEGWLEESFLRHQFWKGVSFCLSKLEMPVYLAADWDCDGLDEVWIFQSGFGYLTLRPAYGATVGSALIPDFGNISNVLSRKEEAWHRGIASDPRYPMFADDSYHRTGEEPQDPSFYQKWFYDKHYRALFNDRIFDSRLTLGNLRKGMAPVLLDLSDVAFQILSIEDTKTCVIVDTESKLEFLNKGILQRLTVQKKYSFSRERSQIELEITVENSSLEAIECWWGVELNIGTDNQLQRDRDFYVNPHPRKCNFLQAGHRKKVQSAHWLLGDIQLNLSSDEIAEGFFYPIEVPISKPTYLTTQLQGHCLMLLWDLSLWAEEQRVWTMRLEWERV